MQDSRKGISLNQSSHFTNFAKTCEHIVRPLPGPWRENEEH
jgi:hypothetical protein